MYRVLLCVALCACAASSYPLEDAKALFEKFIVDYNRQYADEAEKHMRFKMFKQTLQEINALNERHGGIQVFDINLFSDLTPEEKKRMMGLRFLPSVGAGKCKVLTDADIPDADAPDSWDWRDKNVVTSVKDQLQCGSCFSFSSTGNIEGQYAIKHSELLSLSEQQILDCSRKYNNNGCGGGYMTWSLEYLIDAGGILKESDYRYTAGDDLICAFNESQVAVQVTDCVNYDLKSQEKLKQLVYKTGPIAIALDADDFQSYRGYNETVLKNCRLRCINHGVLLVGYGTDKTHGDYWIVKNSWGASWGDEGYVRIERGEGKASCGLLNDAMASAIVA